LLIKADEYLGKTQCDTVANEYLGKTQCDTVAKNLPKNGANIRTHEPGFLK